MSDTHQVSTLELVSYSCGDCSAERAAVIEAHVRDCLVCRRKLQELEQERTAFLEAHPMMPEDALATGQPSVFVQRQRMLMAAAAMLVMFVAGSVVYRAMVARPDGFRPKGDTRVTLYVLGDNAAPEVRSDGVYHPGERIQMAYACGARNRFMLFSVDDSGRVTTYYPADGDSSVSLEKGRDLPLPHSIELDSYLGEELYIAVFSETPLAVAAIREQVTEAVSAADGLGEVALDLGDGVTVSLILTHKREQAE